MTGRKSEPLSDELRRTFQRNPVYTFPNAALVLLREQNAKQAARNEEARQQIALLDRELAFLRSQT